MTPVVSRVIYFLFKDLFEPSDEPMPVMSGGPSDKSSGDTCCEPSGEL